MLRCKRSRSRGQRPVDNVPTRLSSPDVGLVASLLVALNVREGTCNTVARVLNRVDEQTARHLRLILKMGRYPMT
jgi:hypothetical protein